jgi:hypothetical protein
VRGKIEVVQSGDRKKAGKNQILSFGSNLGLCSFSKVSFSFIKISFNVRI